jgi:hypothetical protein
MLRQRPIKLIGIVGFAILGIFCRGRADESPRSVIHFIAVHDRYSLSVPWNLAKPAIQVPLKSRSQKTGLAIFQGHVKEAGAAGKDVLGGDMAIQWGRTQKVFHDIWKERLEEVGTVQMPHSGLAEVYFVSMEGTSFQTWHFNLFNPRTSTLITLSYSWGHDDKSALKKTSANFNDPELADERELLEGLTYDPDYGIPFNKQ